MGSAVDDAPAHSLNDRVAGWGTHAADRVVDPRGRATRLVYDGNHDLVAVTDTSGRTTRTSYDDRHRPLTVQDPLGGVTRYSYDAFDGMTSVTTPRGETTRWERDERGNVVRVIDFASRVRMTASYDARGHVVTRTGATGLSEGFTYDTFGSVATIQGIDGRIARQTSTRTGAPTAIVNGLGEIARFGYDALGRLATASNPGGSLAFGYDLDNRVVSLTDTAAGSSKRLEVAYTPDGRIARRTLGGIDLQPVPDQISGM